jgi:hypothetical protein
VQGSERVRMGRRALGPVSAFLPNNPGAGLPSADVQRDAVRRLERAGYQSVWNNEGVGGKDGLVQLGVLLAATERTTFGSAIANIWARPCRCPCRCRRRPPGPRSGFGRSRARLLAEFGPQLGWRPPPKAHLDAVGNASGVRPNPRLVRVKDDPDSASLFASLVAGRLIIGKAAPVAGHE